MARVASLANAGLERVSASRMRFIDAYPASLRSVDTSTLLVQGQGRQAQCLEAAKLCQRRSAATEQ